MAAYYSEEHAKRIEEKYSRIEALMDEVFENASKCAGAWTLIRWSLRESDGELPIRDNCLSPYVALLPKHHRRCSTIEGMNLVCLFFERKDFAKDEFRKFRNAGNATVRKFEEVYNRLNGDDA